MAQMHQGLTDYRATGAGVWGPYLLAVLAEAYGRSGQATTGLPLLDGALTMLDKTGERWWEAEMYRLKGSLLLQQPIPDAQQAMACFTQALTVARHQQAKTLELRVAMSLSQRWQHQGKRAEAQQLLAEVYGRFTEGFDTADLQDAGALLASMGD
jgi:predicted ATPase